LLPEVTVPDLPADAVDSPDFLVRLSYEYFNKINLTDEDRERNRLYRHQILRNDLYRQSNNLAEYYQNLEMQVKIVVNNQIYISRVAQLTQRTNQFNLTSRRYTVADVTILMNNPQHKIYTLELNDKFGSQGIVGVIITYQKDASTCKIDTFLLSCRVIGRTVEDTFLSFVLNRIKETSTKLVEAQYIPTAKNSLVKDFYGNFGFEKIRETESESLWHWQFAGQEIKESPWIMVF
jgi:FkbH-like protein